MTLKEKWEIAGGAGVFGCVVFFASIGIALLWGQEFWAKVAGTGAVVCVAWTFLCLTQITGNEPGQPE